MTDSDKANARARQREETRRRVYQAALEVFRKDGVAEARIDDVAHAAGVSRGTFYFHFPAKDDVLVERLRESEEVVLTALDGLTPKSPLTEVLDTVAVGLARAWAHDAKLLPDVATVGLKIIAATVADTEADPVRAALAPFFRAAAERGELSRALPPEVLSDVYLSNSLAAMLAWCASGTPSLEQVLRGLNVIFLQGAGVNG